MKELEILHLHGRKEIEDFYRNVLKVEDEEKIENNINRLFSYPDQTLFCVPVKRQIGAAWVTLNHKI